MKRCVNNFANVPRTSSGFLLTQYAFRAQKRYHPGQMFLGHLKKIPKRRVYFLTWILRSSQQYIIDLVTFCHALSNQKHSFLSRENFMSISN